MSSAVSRAAVLEPQQAHLAVVERLPARHPHVAHDVESMAAGRRRQPADDDAGDERQRQADGAGQRARQADARRSRSAGCATAVTPKPAIMPASAPQALVRFPQIASSRTGKEPTALKRERPEEQLQRIGRRRDGQPGRDEGRPEQGDARACRCGRRPAPSRRAGRGRRPPPRWRRSPPGTSRERRQRGGQGAGKRQIDERPAENPRRWAAQTAPRRARS